MTKLTVGAVTGGGSEWVPLTSGTISDNFTLDVSTYTGGTYEDLKLSLRSIEIDTDNRVVGMLLDNGSGVETGTLYETVWTNLHSSVSTANKVPIYSTAGNANDVPIFVNIGNDADVYHSVDITLLDVSSTNTERNGSFKGTAFSSLSDCVYIEGGWKAEGMNSGVLTGIKIASRLSGSDNGTIDAGSYILYGRLAL